MKPYVIRFLLSMLNSRWLNQSPCRYGYINNIEAFSYDNCVSEDKQQPGITVREMLASADRYKSCPINKDGLTIIDGDETREATVWDRHELNLALTPHHHEKV